jgi:hypothetical protein
MKGRGPLNRSALNMQTEFYVARWSVVAALVVVVALAVGPDDEGEEFAPAAQVFLEQLGPAAVGRADEQALSGWCASNNVGFR